MKKYKFNEIEYELVEEYKEGFELEEAQNKITDYFIGRCCGALIKKRNLKNVILLM